MKFVLDKGVVNIKAKIAVIGKRQTTVTKIARPLLAIIGVNERIEIPN